jgi:hypothetical protein
VLRWLFSTLRSGAAILPSDKIPVAHWYSSGWNTWCCARSIKVTATSDRAANGPRIPRSG